MSSDPLEKAIRFGDQHRCRREIGPVHKLEDCGPRRPHNELGTRTAIVKIAEIPTPFLAPGVYDGSFGKNAVEHTRSTGEFVERLTAACPAVRRIDFQGLGFVAAGSACYLATACANPRMLRESAVKLYLIRHKHAETARASIQALFDALRAEWKRVDVVRTDMSVTFAWHDAARHDAAKTDPLTRIHVDTRLFDSVADVVYSMDLGARAIAYDGKNVWLSPAGMCAVTYGVIYPDASAWSLEQSRRIHKLTSRYGLRLALPGLRADAGRLISTSGFDLVSYDGGAEYEYNTLDGGEPVDSSDGVLVALTASNPAFYINYAIAHRRAPKIVKICCAPASTDPTSFEFNPTSVFAELASRIAQAGIHMGYSWCPHKKPLCHECKIQKLVDKHVDGVAEIIGVKNALEAVKAAARLKYADLFNNTEHVAAIASRYWGADGIEDLLTVFLPAGECVRQPGVLRF